MTLERNRKLAAILFADIEGYTRLMQDGEGSAMAILNRFEQVIELKVNEFHGEIIKKYGDGILVLFDSTVDAVQCAYEVQLEFKQNPVVPLRIGIHVGEVLRKGNDVFGNGINIASRVESMSVVGSVIMTQDAYVKIKNQEGFKTRSLGTFVFKNVEEHIEVFALANEGIVVPDKVALKKATKSKRESFFYGKKLWVTLTMTGFLVALIGWFILIGGKKMTGPSLTVDQNSIAVLPLSNLNANDESVSYFADGLTQEIIDQLAGISSITVSAFTISSFYSNQGLKPEEIAKELNVKYLITGTSRLVNNNERVRISIALVDPSSKKTILTRNFDEEMNDAATIQISVAKAVASALNISLTPESQATLAAANTSNGESFRLFLHAKHELAKLTPEGLQISQELLIQALDLDPDYAQAYTLLAWSYSLSADSYVVPNAISGQKASELIDPLILKSIKLNPNSSDIYLVRAATNLFHKNKIEDARKDVEFAIAKNSWPKVPINYCMCVGVATYLSGGQIDKAKELVEMTKVVDPGSVFMYWDRASILLNEEKFRDAINVLLEAVLELDIPYFNSNLGMSLYHAGEYIDALKYIQKAYVQSDGVPTAMTVAYLSSIQFKLGNKELSDGALNELKARITHGANNIKQNLAIAYLGRDKPKEAIRYLEEAMSDQETGMAVLFGSDPIFKNLYNDPRFIELRRKMQYYE